MTHKFQKFPEINLLHWKVPVRNCFPHRSVYYGIYGLHRAFARFYVAPRSFIMENISLEKKPEL